MCRLCPGSRWDTFVTVFCGKAFQKEEEYMNNAEVIRKKKKRRRKRRRRFKMWVYVVGVILLLLIIFGIYRLFIWSPVEKEVKVAIGEELTLDKFTDKDEKASFVTDLSAIDVSKPGEYEIVIKYGHRKFDSKLLVQDLTAPKATPVEVSTVIGTVPEASACVENIEDETEVTVSYKTEPDVSKNGDVDVTVILTDEGGNKTELDTVIHVWEDTEAPVIRGAVDLEVAVGGTVSYKKDVVVTDNLDENPELTIDNSQVNLNKVGKYDVVYTATDFAGNSSSVTITVYVIEEGGSEVSNDQVYQLAEDILDDITDDSMSDMEVAFAIYNWVNKNIAYTNDSDKSSWINGAYQAFTTRSGDCYNYFAAAKALYNVAGIENVDVEKSDTSHSRHYWSLINLGDGWYHVDCTPRKGDGDLFFMVTDEELLDYSEAHSNSHIFDLDAYPERATKSLQSKIDYSAGKIKE